jgi:hypothetical protein
MATVRCGACGASVKCIRTALNVYHVSYGNDFYRGCPKAQERARQNGHWSTIRDKCPDIDAAIDRAVHDPQLWSAPAV